MRRIQTHNCGQVASTSSVSVVGSIQIKEWGDLARFVHFQFFAKFECFVG